MLEFKNEDYTPRLKGRVLNTKDEVLEVDPLLKYLGAYFLGLDEYSLPVVLVFDENNFPGIRHNPLLSTSGEYTYSRFGKHYYDEVSIRYLRKNINKINTKEK